MSKGFVIIQLLLPVFLFDAIYTSKIQETIWKEIFIDDVEYGDSNLFGYLEDSLNCSMCFHLSSVEKDKLDDTEFYVGKINWNDLINETGWAHLNLQISNEVPDFDKAYTAGFLEGLVTHKRIRDFHKNIQVLHFNSANGAKFRELLYGQLNKSIDWITNSIIKETSLLKSVDQNFQQWIKLFMLQIWGITDGYAFSRDYWQDTRLPPINVTDIALMTLDGDFEVLKGIFQCGPKETNYSACISDTVTHRKVSSRCSAFIRLTENNILTDIPFFNGTVAKLAFSSYPGAITSTDDFILTSNQLAITETTLDTPKKQIYRQWYLKNKKRFLDGQYIFDPFNYLRASYVSSTAKEWAENVETYKSNYYDVSSAQWMIVDYKNCCNGTSHLYVVETIPGKIVSKDMTTYLNQNKYWGSENKAFFPSIISSLKDSLRGPDPKFYENTRNVTFATLYNSVTSIEYMKYLMQFAVSDSEMQLFSISPRFDLTEMNSPEGGTDSKGTFKLYGNSWIIQIVDATLIENLRFWAKSGPSARKDNVFQWTVNDTEIYDSTKWPHYGQPNVWRFDWQLVDKYGFTPSSYLDQLEF